MKSHKMNSKYAVGIRVERKAVDFLESIGYVAARSAGSKGMFDVYGICQKGVRLVQCKSTISPVLSRHAKTFSQIRETYVSLFPDKENAINQFITFELWVYEKNKGFTHCFSVGENSINNQYPKGVIVHHG